MEEIIFADLFGLGALLFARYVLNVRPSFRDAVLIAIGGVCLFVFAMFYQTPEVVFSSKGNYLDKKLVLVSVAVTTYGLGAAVLDFSSRAKVKQ